MKTQIHLFEKARLSIYFICSIGFLSLSFSLSAQSVKLISPNGGEVWQAGTTQSITWNPVSTGTVSISYSINNGSNWTTIQTGLLAKTGSPYAWNIPSGINSTNCLLKLDYTNGLLYGFDFSDGIFTISGSGTSTQELSPENLLTIYPVPASDNITISHNNVTLKSIGIYNTSGKLAMEISKEDVFNNSVNIPVTGLASGIYVVVTETKEKKIISKPIIISHSYKP